ncbi:MAG: hypothetical protein IJW27_00730, partial [Clostridia bacterium]|nr:hypothetical protein [Clostridia bacterium]
MKNQKTRVIALLLCVVLLISAMPLYSFATEAQDGYSYAETLGAKIGDNIYDNSFSELTDVPADWTVASGSAALGTAEQGGVTKAGYSISGANGSMNTVRIKVPAENYVVKLSMYQVTSYWGGDNGRVYVYKQGKNSGSDEYFENAHIELGGYKRTSWIPPANGASIYKYNADGTLNTSDIARVTDIGGGFGADGNSVLTLYIYSYNGINHYVTETGTLLASVSDAKAADENYFAIAGDYMRILLSDFEVYELVDPEASTDEYNYLDTLGAELGDNIYNHNFGELTDVPADWTVASGSAALGTAEQGGVTKAGYSISGANGSMNSVRIKIPAENYVVKLSMYQVTGYWGGDNGRVYVYKQGKNSGSDEYFENAQMQLGGYKRTSTLPPANGAAIYKYDENGATSNNTATVLADIGGGFGADGNSLLTLFIYSYNGTNYYVNESGTLLASVSDAKAA